MPRLEVYCSTMTRRNGFLYLEDIRLSDFLTSSCDSEEGQVNSPVFLYSQRQIHENVASYIQAFHRHDLNYLLGYAAKANGNPHLVRLMADLGKSENR